MNEGGKLSLDWLQTARENQHDGQTVEHWLGDWVKSRVLISEQGCVFAVALGRNLTQGEIEEACKAVDDFA